MSESHQHHTRAPTAYHEAGHAVVAWYCGGNIGNVSMEPDQDHGIGGYARHGDGDREWGDLGILFRFSKEHGVIVEEPDGTLRLPTDAEREHNTITDECVELESWERGVMNPAAGEAAERIVAPESFHPIHSSNRAPTAERRCRRCRRRTRFTVRSRRTPKCQMRTWTHGSPQRAGSCESPLCGGSWTPWPRR